jgi:hypothetical protein
MWRVVTAAVLIAGCSSGDGEMDMAVADLAMPDLTPGPDMKTPVLVTGTKLLDGTHTVLGITTDDFVAAADTTRMMKVVPVAGGMAEPIATDTFDGRISGKVVFVWSEVDQVTRRFGAIKVWTNANKVQRLGETSTIATRGATLDGEYLMFTDNANTTGSIADLYVAKSDGSGKLMVLPQRMAFEPCQPRIAPAGQKFVVAHCLPMGDAGAAPATLSLVDPATGMATTLASGLVPFVAVNKPGTHALAVTTTSNILSVITLAGGTPVVIEPGVAVREARFNAAGDEVFYVTQAGALKRTPIAAPAPMTLGGTGVRGIDDISPDEKFLAYHKLVDGDGVGDLFLAPTTPPGTPVTIAAGEVAVFGDVFTTDSSRLLYYSDLDSSLAGTLNAHPVAGGAEIKISNSKVWVSFSTASGKVVYNDNWKRVMQAGRADIKVADGTGGTNLISIQAEDSIRLNADRTKVVYMYRVDSSKTGLYAAPVD